MEKPEALEELIQALRCLPGVGPKSAQRMAYHLLQRDQKGAERLVDARSSERAGPHSPLRAVQHLHRVGDLRRSAPRRGATRRSLCVVESPGDLLMMEQTQSYSGSTSS